ncbi:histidine utilization repressor [Mariniblastus sp.]|nr:histidine utilization repressor [Mariniblastus sp.]
MTQVLQYKRIKAYILDGIDGGDWPAGSLLPSENQLAEQFSLSRMTVNRAIKELESDGIVDRIQGKGTFVTPPRPLTSVLKIQGINQEIIARGGVYSCQVLGLKSVEAPAEVAEKLGVKNNTKVFFSCILHIENGTPIQLAQRWLIPSLAPEYLQQNFQNQTPHEFLMSVAPFTHGEHSIEACMPGAIIRRRLQLRADEPTLLIHRRTWVQKKPATYVKLYHPGNRFQITTQLTR